jgi:hypothetical protein
MLRLALLMCIAVSLIPACDGERCQGGGSCALIPQLFSGDTIFSGPGPGDGFSGPRPGPSPRYLASIAYDASHQNFVLFGGHTANGVSGETWIFDEFGGQYATPAWRRVQPVHNPPPRWGAAIAYDPKQSVVLMYGGLIPGHDKGQPGSDTWAWDGADWSDVTQAAGGPGPRDGAAMVTAGDGVLLFGGHVGNVSYFSDAFSWDGRNWSRVDRGPGPAGRAYAAVAWSSADALLFVFGGTGMRSDAGPGATGVPLSDGWELKDGSWSEINGSGPSALTLGNALWTPTTSFAVLNGLSCPTMNNQVWSWDSHTWANDRWSTLFRGGQFGRWGAAMAQDDDGEVLTFGGSEIPDC